ncbi:hypothetical protein EDD53_0928 [Pacificibacter maritimus]|uniref:Uncharacterized protein n=1 Tax=Pacificibacter maritimus TaxID=762213 RepID=A0A3N4VD72_9RHOB|nr:hypothetical protein EDD53_0928 [Pacificibacter maritimus]
MPKCMPKPVSYGIASAKIQMRLGRQGKHVNSYKDIGVKKRIRKFTGKPWPRGSISSGATSELIFIAIHSSACKICTICNLDYLLKDQPLRLLSLTALKQLNVVALWLTSTMCSVFGSWVNG